MLWYYAYGKPIEHVEHTGTGSLLDELRALTPDELHARALAVAAMLKKDDPDDGLSMANSKFISILCPGRDLGRIRRCAIWPSCCCICW